MVDAEAIAIQDERWTPIPEDAGPDSRSWTNDRDTLPLQHVPNAARHRWAGGLWVLEIRQKADVSSAEL